ncbi:hypothetical protein VNO80_16276 [Phaseolus coccineus]|uniref:Uncharacterized protein n=1 Tax=Phaseolus coccineus TaxID=3886 RepID=A0AAN9MLS2_PHACN
MIGWKRVYGRHTHDTHKGSTWATHELSRRSSAELPLCDTKGLVKDAGNGELSMAVEVQLVKQLRLQRRFLVDLERVGVSSARVNMWSIMCTSICNLLGAYNMI